MQGLGCPIKPLIGCAVRCIGAFAISISFAGTSSGPRAPYVQHRTTKENTCKPDISPGKTSHSSSAALSFTAAPVPRLGVLVGGWRAHDGGTARTRARARRRGRARRRVHARRRGEVQTGRQDVRYTTGLSANGSSFSKSVRCDYECLPLAIEVLCCQKLLVV